jgi:hypothetical protein
MHSKGKIPYWKSLTFSMEHCQSRRENRGYVSKKTLSEISLLLIGSAQKRSARLGAVLLWRRHPIILINQGVAF